MVRLAKFYRLPNSTSGLYSIRASRSSFMISIDTFLRNKDAVVSNNGTM